MSKFKSMSRGAYAVVGFVVALLLVPTAAYAAINYGGIQGTSGNRVDVTGAGQIKVAEADPNAFFQSGPSGISLTTPQSVGGPPAGSELVVTVVHVDVFQDPTPGLFNGMTFSVRQDSCYGNQVGTYFQTVNPGGIGDTEITLEPGLVVPNGDDLCVVNAGSVRGWAYASGYTVRAGS